MTMSRNAGGRTAQLKEIQSKLRELLGMVDAALSAEGSEGTPSERIRARSPAAPTHAQTYPPGYDYRDDPEGLFEALTRLQAKVEEINDNDDLDLDELRRELCIRAAEARCLQTQCALGSPEANLAINVIRLMTKIVSEEQPGFVYGLAQGHSTDWGQKILDLENESG